MERAHGYGALAVVVVGLFVLGGVAGFAWALDRQVRGGILRQQVEARARADWVALDELPAHVPDAFLAVVDPSFRETGALRTGGSGTTLARELVRQVHRLPDSLSGRARELVMGPVLERRSSKRALLELYLNRIYLGEDRGYPIFGIHHAAREYFGKDARELTLSEAATLAGLLLAPRIEDPDGQVGAVGVRRNEVLRGLLLQGRITPEQYHAAREEQLGFQPGPDRQPMTRPGDWSAQDSVIRLPERFRLAPDSATAG